MNKVSCYHFIGLDIHKRTISLCVKDVTGRTLHEGTIGARPDAIVRFAQSRTTPFIAGIEATLFSGWVYDVLSRFAVQVRVGHPTRLRALCKNKNDRIDAELLANLLRADLFPSCYMAGPQVRELRRALRYRNFVVAQATRMKNKAATILMEVGVQYTKAKLHQRRYFSELLDGLKEVPHSVVELLRMSRINIELFTDMQRKLLHALTHHAVLRDRVALLKTVGGVGDVTALTWALEIDDPHRFSCVKRVHSYCGLCSAQHASGGKQWRAPLSKERNPHLQTILIEAAKLAPCRYPHLARVHQAALDRAYNRNRATLQVARKLAAYLLAVDKSGQPFVVRGG